MLKGKLVITFTNTFHLVYVSQAKNFHRKTRGEFRQGHMISVILHVMVYFKTIAVEKGNEG